MWQITLLKGFKYEGSSNFKWDFYFQKALLLNFLQTENFFPFSFSYVDYPNMQSIVVKEMKEFPLLFLPEAKVLAFASSNCGWDCIIFKFKSGVGTAAEEKEKVGKSLKWDKLMSFVKLHRNGSRRKLEENGLKYFEECAEIKFTGWGKSHQHFRFLTILKIITFIQSMVSMFIYAESITYFVFRYLENTKHYERRRSASGKLVFDSATFSILNSVLKTRSVNRRKK